MTEISRMFINKHSVTDICHKNDFFKLVIKNTSAAKLKKNSRNCMRGILQGVSH